jgi:hypothetical protein
MSPAAERVLKSMVQFILDNSVNQDHWQQTTLDFERYEEPELSEQQMRDGLDEIRERYLKG